MRRGTGQVRILESAALLYVRQWLGRDRSPKGSNACVSSRHLATVALPSLISTVDGSYYFLNTFTGQTDTITPFPPGFRMVSGDAMRRNDTNPERPSGNAIGFNCLNYHESPEPSLGRHFLPGKAALDQFCADGLRTEVMFPSCWDGQRFESPAEQDRHLRFPNEVMTGFCPAGFDIRLPSLFYENIWDTTRYADRDGQFVFSQGDPTGYGFHGDFMEGWQLGVLQQAVTKCTSLSGMVGDCPVFELVSEEAMASCKFDPPAAAARENVAGPSLDLPGDNPVQVGPASAQPHPLRNGTLLLPQPTSRDNDRLERGHTSLVDPEALLDDCARNLAYIEQNQP
ncbi:MAG: hypothetical protein M1828_001047 [Chrysothrix sp. TS-e1954]|nr:MAG: hypothetical protein M1828_001047 [Chrysothrix sp. TS-e1954]